MRSKQCTRQMAGSCVNSFHLWETSAALVRRVGIGRWIRHLVARCGGSVPRMSKEDFWYFSRRRIWADISPGMHAKKRLGKGESKRGGRESDSYHLILSRFYNDFVSIKKQDTFFLPIHAQSQSICHRQTSNGLPHANLIKFPS